MYYRELIHSVADGHLGSVQFQDVMLSAAATILEHAQAFWQGVCPVVELLSHGVSTVSFRRTLVLQVKIQLVLTSPSSPAQVSTGRGVLQALSYSTSTPFHQVQMLSASGSGFFRVPVTNGVQALEREGNDSKF